MSLLTVFPVTESQAAPLLHPVALACDGRANPLGIDSMRPLLGWKLQSSAPEERGLAQTAYQICASSTRANLATGHFDLWDSGRIASGATNQISYGGSALRYAQQVFWKVRVWDGQGHSSLWSEPAQWIMGLLKPADWKSDWVAAPLPAQSDTDAGTILFRHTFSVKPRLRRAVLSVCGLGQYEMTLNGRKAGDALLTPGWTNYKKTCLYDTYDITPLLHEGRNAAGLFLGSGMYRVLPGRYTKFIGIYGPLMAIAQIRLEYADGSTTLVGTSPDWKSASGPITFSSPYGGEDYDARLLPAGWDLPTFDDTRWALVRRTAGPGGELRGTSESAPPVRAFETLAPVHVTHLTPEVSVYDLGQNAALMPRVVVHGPAGATVRIVPAELVKADGSADRSSVGGKLAYWQYTLAGGVSETYFPRFFYHGCRYLQIECAAPAGQPLPVVDKLEGVTIHADCESVGTFACSSELFNKIDTLVRHAQTSNMMSILTDCPHRERLGWLEQDYLNGPSLRYHFALGSLAGKIMNDIADSQQPDGRVPDIAPEFTVFKGGFRDSPEWGSASLQLPWQQYQFDGDLALLRRHYALMKRYVAYLDSRAVGGIIDYGLGDWYDLGPRPPGVSQLTPVALTATALYYSDTEILAHAATALGLPAEAKVYVNRAAQIRTAFNTHFYNVATHNYATGSQTANALPLALGLAYDANRPAVLEAIVQDVRSRGDGLTAGDVGYRYLLRALAENGRSDVVYAMNSRSDKPGYGYQLAQGATSLTEAWNAGRTSSQNHFMLGQIVEWFYHDLAGIQPDPAGPGFAKVTVKPSLVAGIDWVQASYNSVHGKIHSSWTRTGIKIEMRVITPPGTTATVFVPAPTGVSVQEGGIPAEKASHVRFLRREQSYAVYAIGSGSYAFTVFLSSKGSKQNEHAESP